MADFDSAWVGAVCAECDPVFETAQVGFVRQVHVDPGDVTTALLWEADPTSFAARYPDSGVVETYGEQWPDVHCLDWWVYLDHDARRARLSVEGWNLPELWLPLTGHGQADGCALADVFARLLAVRSPRVG